MIATIYDVLVMYLLGPVEIAKALAKLAAVCPEGNE
jgi:hypothetical protein